MFNSSKMSKSPVNYKGSYSARDDTLNETSRSFLPPKVTSTPLNSIFATPPKSQFLTPRRYSLSEVATPPRSGRRDFIRSKSQHPPGPLLASTKFNINVSTFEDVKSPGLTSRIVQYNEETEREKEQRHPPTHQAKYGSLGLFPVVHLFKKKLPLLEQKPRHVTMRVASPDYMKHKPEYNRKLLEGIVTPSGIFLGKPGHSNISENSTSTRSVLDALKEISRKRIHANEELELHEDTGKRLRTDSEDCTDSNKRLRDESPIVDTTSPSRPASKKICMYDEYAASRSSMDFLNLSNTVVPKRKSISISTITENPKDSKQVKVINAETQTVPDEETSKCAEEDKKEDDQSQNEKIEKVETVLKVFDDAPLDRIRKNRLAALMGTLVGKDPILEPKPDYSSLLQDSADDAKPVEATKAPATTLVSILTINKSPRKSDKHVHFNVPESSSDTASDSTLTSSTTPIFPTTPTQLTDAENSNSNAVENKKIDAIISVSSVGANPASPGVVVPTPSFPAITNTSSNLSVPNVTPTAPVTGLTMFTNKPENEVKSVFGSVIPKSPVTTASSTASPPKMGGFKFDLAKPATTSITTTPTTKIPSFSFGSPSTASTTVTNAVNLTTFSSPVLSSSVTLSNHQADVKVTLGQRFFNKPPPPPLSNQVTQASALLNKPTFSFGPASTAPISATFNFDGTKTSTANISVPPTASGSVDLFGNISSGSSGFTTVTTSAKTSFSTLTSVANKGLITSPSVTSTVGGTSSVLPAFGTSVNTTFSSPSGNGFGNASTTSIPSYAASGGFGQIPTNSSTTPSGGFGTNLLANRGFTPSTTSGGSGFGTSTTTGASGFGTSTGSAFGTPTTAGTIGFGTSTAGFGTTQNSATSGFGTSTSTLNAPTTGFGTSTSTLNAPTTGFGTFGTSTNSFGTPAGSASSGFGSLPSSNVNLAKSGTPFATPSTIDNSFSTQTTTGNAFGNTTFGPANNSTGFGAPTSTVFGFGNASSTAVPSGGFGASTATVNTGFGTTTAGFGTATSGGFGTTTTAGFGAPTTTGFGTNPSSFATNAGSLFGNTNIPSFGGTSNTPSFGSTSSGGSFTDPQFGGGTPTTTTSVFGAAVTTASAFNNDTSNKIFGGTTTPFGAPTTTSSSIFGSSQPPAFGAGTSSTTAATPAVPFTFTAKCTASSTFGTTNTTTPSFGGGFGQGSTGFGSQQSSTFGAPNKTPIFGNANTAGFGATAPPTFGGTQQQQPFGSSGSVFNKPQAAPQNSFGSPQFSFNQQQQPPQQNNTSSFGATPSQPGVFAFGSGAPEKPAAFNFNAAASAETPKKFDFTGGNPAPPAFGASFGGASAGPAFGAPVPVAPGGGFSIGAGPPSSSRPARTLIKGKRRT